MVMYCPYCDMEINERQLENEDGCCPECGAFISPGMAIMDDEDEEDEYASIFGDEDDDVDDDEEGELDEDEEEEEEDN